MEELHDDYLKSNNFCKFLNDVMVKYRQNNSCAMLALSIFFFFLQKKVNLATIYLMLLSILYLVINSKTIKFVLNTSQKKKIIFNRFFNNTFFTKYDHFVFF